MRFLILVLLTFSLQARAEDSLDFSRPPFWMPTAAEMTHLDVEQLDFYVQGFVKIATAFPGLEGISKSRVLEFTERPEGWRSLQTRVYRACQWENERYSEICEKAADLRVAMLMMRGNMKAENREALGIREPDAEKEASGKDGSRPKPAGSAPTPESSGPAPAPKAPQKPS